MNDKKTTLNTKKSESQKQYNSDAKKNNGIDVSKILKREGLTIDNDNKVNIKINKIAKKLIMNIIKNIIHVKEALGQKSNTTIQITKADVKQAQNIMDRFKFYANIKYSVNNSTHYSQSKQKGGNRIVMPPEYYDPTFQSTAYDAPLGQTSMHADTNVIRQGFDSTTFDPSKGLTNIGGPEPFDGFKQTGSGFFSNIFGKGKRKGVQFIGTDSLESILLELNQIRTKKIELEENVKGIIKESANKNLTELFAYYKKNVSTVVNVATLKEIIQSHPRFTHFDTITNSQ
jgi:hypothetical protein